MKIMKGYRKGTYTLVNSMFNEEDFDPQDYIDYCEDNDIEPGVGEYFKSGFYEWCRDMAYDNYDADMDNIVSCKEYQLPVVITGSLGLWWGKPEIEPVVCNSVYEAIQKCIGKDTDEVRVEWCDGVINVEAYHHDGCNCFSIRALSKKGEKKVGSDYKPHDFKQLPYLYAIF